MPRIDELLDTDHPDLGRKGSLSWNKAIFKKAFGGPEGAHPEQATISEVARKLGIGFSILVYVHGNCMAALAECIKDDLKHNWLECGQEVDENGIVGLWGRSTGIMESLWNWIRGTSNQTPSLIYHNLDFLTTGRGDIYPHTEAHTAMFSLVSTTRSGLVLGLSDLAAGELPESLERIFVERRSFDEIPLERFHKIIPKMLAEKTSDIVDEIPQNKVWLLWSRLRWSDPMRAVKIMQTVADQQSGQNFKAVLEAIWKLTRSGRFKDPGKSETIRGIDPDTLTFLKNSIIKPYRRWLSFDGNQDQCERELKKLPPGLILFGPPGTGKTHLARWVANSMGLPMLVETSANMKSIYFGESEKNVHRLFQEARRAAPCVVILDDADDMFPDRNSTEGSTAGVEVGMVQAALQELEGMKGRPSGVLVIATTNRYSAMDPGIKTRLRPHVAVPYPLSESQIDEIMTVFADDFGYHLDPQIKSRLRKRFWQPIIPDATIKDGKKDRMRAGTNLFSPREIQNAFMLLDDGTREQSKMKGDRYCPGEVDVERMEEYYKRLKDIPMEPELSR